MDLLYNIDISLFYVLNGLWTHPILDAVMPFLTDLNHQLVFRILFASLIVYALILDGARGRWAVLFLVLTLVVSDQVNSFVLKELFARPRPCLELSDVRLLVDCGGGKSFPSSHAVNTAAAAVVIGYFYPKAIWYLLGLAFLVSYSRIYVGAHYPFDVLAGTSLGLVWGFSVTLSVPATRDLFSRMRKRRSEGR